MKLARRVARNTLYNTGAVFTGSVIGFFLSVILARLLGPENFGIYSLSVIIVNITVAVLMAGMDNSLIRYISYYQRDLKIVRAVFRRLLKIRIVLTLLISGLILSLSTTISDFFGDGNLRIPIMISSGIIFVHSIFMLFSSFLKGEQDFRSIFITNTIYQMLRLVVIPSLAFLFLTIGALVGFFIVDLTLIIFLMLLVVSKYREHIFGEVHKGRIPGLISYVGYMSIAKMTGVIFVYIDVLMIGFLIGSVGVSYYRVASMIVLSLLGLLNSIATVLLPAFSQLEKSDIGSSLLRLNKYISVVIFPFALTFGIFSKEVIVVIYGKEYLPSGDVLTVLSLLLIIGGFNYFGTVINAVGRADLSAYIVLMGAVINIILNYILILKMGIVGAAAATVISRALVVLSFITITKNIIGIKPNLSVITKPFIATISMAVLYILVPNPVDVIHGLALTTAGFSLYIITLFLTGGITKQDLVYVFNAFRL